MLRIGALLIALVTAAPPALAEASRDCQSNNHELAVRGCTRLIQQNPRNAVNYYNRAISYRELGKIDLALADYNRAIELNPRTAGFHPLDRSEPALCDRAQQSRRGARESEPA
jgi:Flp pilus assembly protein TadD